MMVSNRASTAAAQPDWSEELAAEAELIESNEAVARLITGRKSSAYESLYGAFGKRALDLILGLPLFLVALPIIMLAALIIAVANGRPILYRARRVGRDGREFWMLKLRTMVPNAEHVLEEWRQRNPDLAAEYDANFKLKDDPRITPIGRFLRRTSLDELPQLWNVLRGDMSLVGPRPIVADELQHYGGNAGDFLSVRPGITGAWQVDVRNEVSYPERTWYELTYIRTFDVKRDASILVKTLAIPFRFNGR